MVYLGILTKNEYKFTVYHRCYEHMSRYVLSTIHHTTKVRQVRRYRHAERQQHIVQQ